MLSIYLFIFQIVYGFYYLKDFPLSLQLRGSEVTGMNWDYEHGRDYKISITKSIYIKA